MTKPNQTTQTICESRNSPSWRRCVSACCLALWLVLASLSPLSQSVHGQVLEGPLTDKRIEASDVTPTIASQRTAAVPPILRAPNRARLSELPAPLRNTLRTATRLGTRPSTRPKTRLTSTMASRVGSVGDEAFTEPIETIKIAAAENGIVGKVVVKRGDTVGADDLLFELDMTVLEATRRLALAKASSKARLKAAEVEFEAKTKSYNKRVQLLADRAGSPEEVEKAKTAAELAKQSIEAILEEQEQASLETKGIETKIERRRTRSPIDGVVVDIRRKPGEYISSNDPHIATVVQLDTLRVVFHLPTKRAASIKAGDIENLLLPETGQRTEGVVEYVAPITNADSGRVRVEVLVDNKSREYRSGVRCRILEPSTSNSTLTPIRLNH